MSNLPTNRGSANVDLRAWVFYNAVRGDTFAPFTSWFFIGSVEENFTGSTFRMQIRKNGTIIKELTLGNGINLVGASFNGLQYVISAADMQNWAAGEYTYDVQRTDGSGIVTTRQAGSIFFDQDETR